MNLILAVLWFLLGIVLVAYDSLTGDTNWRLRIVGYPLSPGWLMLLLSAYNLVRWWFQRSGQRALRIAQACRHRHSFRDHLASKRVIDPTFDFTSDQPPSSPNVTDHPPSAN
jgi:hypothetical protein